MYRIEIDTIAQGEIQDAAAYIARDSPIAAETWMDGLLEAILDLQDMPFAHAAAREDPNPKHGSRQRLYHSHRIIYTVEDDVIHILRVRHAAQENALIRPRPKQ